MPVSADGLPHERDLVQDESQSKTKQHALSAIPDLSLEDYPPREYRTKCAYACTLVNPYVQTRRHEQHALGPSSVPEIE
jgi:hypothetical protein